MANLTSLQDTANTLAAQVQAGNESVARAEAKQRIEHEWRVDLQEKEVQNIEQINSLQLNIKKLNEEIKVYSYIVLILFLINIA